MNKNPEQFTNPESHEQPSARQIEIIMVRHGQQESYEDPDSKLSHEGEKQAEEFSLAIIDEYRNDNVIIKIKKSTEVRASQTADIITATLASKIENDGIENIKLLKTRPSKHLKTTGALGEMMKAGVPSDKVVDEWLYNYEKYPEAKEPKDVVGQLNSVISSAQKLSERLPSDEPKILFIWVTHETAHSALLNSITGKNTEELGGSIGHLE
ncbi:histidine phosphatase family protein, partial [Patescibacteria group bacterium]|nr:histidine phosphatase family protein [Patescibacteria group bacterium]